MKRIFTVFLKIAAIFAGILLVMSFFGKIWDGFDSLAIFRPAFWVGSFLLLIFVQGGWRWLLAIVLIFAAIPFYPLLRAPPPVEDAELRIYQHNLLYTNPAPDLALVTGQLHPDVLTLQEVSAALQNLEALEDYPHQQNCSQQGLGLVVVASKRPFIASGCSEAASREFAWATLELDSGQQVTIVSMHLHWPFPYGQRAQLENWWPELAKLPKPVIIAGDFNQVPWSYAVRETARQTEGEIVGGLRLTLTDRRPGLYLPIDHIIVPKGSSAFVRKLNRYGSDHNALLLDWRAAAQ